jgi:ABC-type dipeptide/oligopeptide/nickel transport system permease subunit
MVIGEAASAIDLRARLLSSMKWMRRRLLLIVGSIMLALCIFAVFFPATLAPKDPLKSDIRNRLAPPFWYAEGSVEFPLGTDALGRDLLSRIIYSARISFSIGILAATLSAFIGVTIGLVAGYFGGLLDTVLMRLTDIQLAFPATLLAIALLTVVTPSVLSISLVLAIPMWVIHTRTIRGMVLSLKERAFVLGARALGASSGRIIFRYIVPFVVGQVLVFFILQVAIIIQLETGLSYLGLGIKPPVASWGNMLAENREYLTTAPWAGIFPGLAVIFAVLGISFVGEGIREILGRRLWL